MVLFTVLIARKASVFCVKKREKIDKRNLQRGSTDKPQRRKEIKITFFVRTAQEN